MRDIMIDPVMFKLSQDYVQANGADLHDEAKVQEEEELFKRKKVKEPNPDEALKDIHYAMYF
jgi:tRNA(Leu) C34 or U34 (ribose-2'-O)-methylase TrmL